MTSDIGEIRRRIDAIDEQIQGLIDDRARLAREVGASKQASAAVDFYRPEREAEVLRNVLARNRGPLKNEEMLRLFREIMSACLAQQEPLKVAFLGPEGTLHPRGGHDVTSVTRYARCRCRMSKTSSAKSKREARTSASCRSRTPRKARSITRSTCS